MDKKIFNEAVKNKDIRMLYNEGYTDDQIWKELDNLGGRLGSQAETSLYGTNDIRSNANAAAATRTGNAIEEGLASNKTAAEREALAAQNALEEQEAEQTQTDLIDEKTNQPINPVTVDYENMSPEEWANPNTKATTEEYAAFLLKEYPDASPEDLVELFEQRTEQPAGPKLYKALGIDTEEETEVETETETETEPTTQPGGDDPSDSIPEDVMNGFISDTLGYSSMDELKEALITAKEEGKDVRQLQKDLQNEVVIASDMFDKNGNLKPALKPSEFMKESGRGHLTGLTMASMALSFLSGGKFPVVDFAAMSGDKAAYQQYVDTYETQQQEALDILKPFNDAVVEGRTAEFKSEDKEGQAAQDFMAAVEGQREVYSAMPMAELELQVQHVNRMEDSKVAAYLSELQDKLGTDSAIKLLREQEDIDLNGMLKKLEKYGQLDMEMDEMIKALGVLAAEGGAAANAVNNIKLPGMFN